MVAPLIRAVRRSTLVALAAAAAVGGWILLFERGEPDLEPEGTPVFDVEADEILAVTIRRPDEPEVRLAREDGEWRVHAGDRPGVAADQGEVDLLLQNVESLRAEREIPAGSGDGADLAAFGLATPELTVEVETAEGAGRAGFGDETPAPGNRYLLFEDAVLVVSAFSRNNFDRAAWDLSDRRLLRFDSPAARRLVLTAGRETVELSREDGTWRIVAPFRMAADPFEASSLAEKLLDAHMLGPIPAGSEVADPVAFDPPRLTARLDLVTGAEETPATATIRFGPSSASPAGVFVRRDDGSIAVVEDALLRDLEESVADRLAGVRSLDLFRFAAFRVNELRIEAPVETLIFRREDGDEGRIWVLEAGAAEPVPVDAAAVEDLLYRLNSTQAEDVAAEDPAPLGEVWTIAAREDAEYGGPATEETVTLTVADDGVGHALRAGDDVPLMLPATAWPEILLLIEEARVAATDP